jgi:hypothetical protein
MLAREREQGSMKTASTFVSIVSLAALVALTQATPAMAATAVPAPAVHTAAHARHGARGHRRAGHRAIHPVLRAARASVAQPISRRPPPHPNERRPVRPRAALPVQLHGHRQLLVSKTGQRQALAAAAFAAPLATPLVRLDPGPEDREKRPENPPTLGRGPPQAGPMPPSPFPLRARPGRNLGFAPPSTPISDFHSSRHTSFFDVVPQGQPFGRSHACRLEGPAACFSTPSSGGVP